MRATTFLMIAAALVAAALGTGYWWGSRGQPPPAAHTAQDGSAPARKVLYYRHPMGLPDTSPVPKKDEMNMDYIPVYEGDVPPANMVKISLDKVQKLGVRTEPVSERNVERTVRAVGVIEPNERRIFTIAPKFEGWIERLYANATGEPVGRGQPLMDVYSPGLVATQEEYLIAWRGLQSLKDAAPEVQSRMRDLVDSSLQRLSYWDISREEIERLQRDGRATRTLVLRSRVSGVVLEKMAFEGMRFMPGEVLYRIGDLSMVWLIADIFEQDLPLLSVGQSVNIALPAFPGRSFTGKVIFIYPTLNTGTRTARVRIEIGNPDGALRPGMYASLELMDVPRNAALTVPDSAVLDSGTRRVVIVERGAGLFEPREVRLGMRGESYVEVLEGVTAGERVVVAANFLIDAESNMKSALGAFGGHNHGGAAPGGAAQDQKAPPAQPAGAEPMQAPSGSGPGSTGHEGH
jgi:Cu(I)/Ag(I) efflux system membrane fusion protein